MRDTVQYINNMVYCPKVLSFKKWIWVKTSSLRQWISVLLATGGGSHPWQDQHVENNSSCLIRSGLGQTSCTVVVHSSKTLSAGPHHYHLIGTKLNPLNHSWLEQIWLPGSRWLDITFAHWPQVPKFAVLLLFSSFAAGRFFAAAAGLLRGGMPDASILAPATI